MSFRCGTTKSDNLLQVVVKLAQLPPTTSHNRSNGTQGAIGDGKRRGGAHGTETDMNLFHYMCEYIKYSFRRFRTDIYTDIYLCTQLYPIYTEYEGIGASE